MVALKIKRMAVYEESLAILLLRTVISLIRFLVKLGRKNIQVIKVNCA